MDDFFASFSQAKAYAIETRDLSLLRKLAPTTSEVIALAEVYPSDIHYILWIKKIPFDALEYLARNGDHEAKMRIAIKYPLNRETYEFLSEQADEIKVRLFSNKKVPDEIREKLLADPSDFVSEETRRWSIWQSQQKK